MRRLAAATVALGLLLLTPAAVADEADVLELDAEIEAGDHPEMSVTVTAPRELVGVDVPGGAFSVEENGEPRDVNVERLPSDDLEVVLLIDTSGSMGAGDAMPATRAAAIDFVGQLPPSAHVGVMEFHTEPEVVSELSDDHDEHLAAIEGLRPDGMTALYDGIGAALDQFGEDDEDARRAVVLLSDGGDTTSDAELEDATAQLEDADATLYAIELVTNETDPEALQALADAGDGDFVSADDTAALAAVFDEVAGQLVNRYEVTYTSEAFDAAEVRVAVDHDGTAAETTTEVDLPAAPPEPEPEEETVVPPPREGSTLLPGWLASDEARILGLTAAGLALLLLLLVAFVPREGPSQISASAQRGQSGDEGSIPGISALARSVTGGTDRLLRRRGYSGGLNQALERAGVNLRPGEFVVLVACGAVTGFAVGWLLANVLLGVLLLIGVIVGSRVALRVMTDRRRKAFADQLGDTLQLLAGTLRAGYGLMQAIDSVAKESPSPTAEEFRRLVVETRLGRDVNEAMHHMHERVGNEDFEWVIQSIGIHREVGGDLAEILDTVAGTIRERNQIRRQVQALSAEGKLSAWILFALPFAVGGFVSFANPGYLTVLTEDLIGWAMLGMGVVLLTAGGLWLRKTVQIQF